MADVMARYRALLYRALAEPIGIVVETPDWEKLRGKLYRARTDAQDTQLDQLAIRRSPLAEGHLVIIQTSVLKPKEIGL